MYRLCHGCLSTNALGAYKPPIERLVLVGSSNQPTHADVSRSLEELVSLVRRINSQNESLRDTFVLLTQSKKVKLDTLSARLLNLS